MLARLFVQNYALIEKTEIQFQRGLNILTGETGAGKSILLGAIGLILGRRAEAAVLTDPALKCIVEAEFAAPEGFIQQLLEAEPELELEAEPTLILRREILPSGKSRAFVNDTPVNLNVLRTVTSALVDLHGQHENVKLNDPAVQLSILDQYAGLQEPVRRFGHTLSKLRGVERQARELIEQSKQAKQQLDYYRFQVKELNNAQLTVEEEEQIEDELSLLQNAEQISETLNRNTAILYDIELSVSAQLSDVVRSLEKVASLHRPIAAEIQKIQDARYLIDDAAAELQNIAESIETDAERLAYLNERQSLIHHLKLKFGVATVAELLELKAEFETKLIDYENIDDKLAELRTQKKALVEEMTALGLEIETRRKEAAQALETAILQILPAVGLDKAHLFLDLRRLKAEKGPITLDGETIMPETTGINSLEIKIRTNPGMPYGTLAQIASGGEISRVLLAIKAALAGKMQMAVLIFDEIDTGISGEVALKVGRVMERLAQNHQIIAITHLPQIASRRGEHFFIYKTHAGDRTYSHVRQLTQTERVTELAVMMSGENPGPAALNNAQALLEME